MTIKEAIAILKSIRPPTGEQFPYRAEMTAYEMAIAALEEQEAKMFWSRYHIKEREDTGLTPEDVPTALEMSKIYVALQKLKAYEQAEAEGRLIVPPCKVGDTVYTIWDNEVRDNTVTDLVVDGLGQHILAQYNRGGAIRDYKVDCLGKTVFTSREAAEAALKEAQG